MKIALLQTMYDEHTNVLHNIRVVKNIYKDAVCLVTHSFDRNTDILNQIKSESYYDSLPNLGITIERMKLPANAISRNYSNLFNRFYNINVDVDLIVALAGDTHLFEVSNFERRYKEMQQFGYYVYVCQAKGQNFWNADKALNRLQSNEVPDFMPQLFFVNGEFARETKVFSNIQIVNEYTSEQCLGEEFLRHSSLDHIGMLNKDPSNWMSYTDGVRWQVLTSGRPGRN